jgi:hypothetical protein
MTNPIYMELIQKLQLKVQILEHKNATCENLRIELIQKLMNSEAKERRLKKNKSDLKRRLKCKK